MHLLEIRQDLNDTSLKNEIYTTSRLVRNLLECVDKTNDINYTDYIYISTLTSKAKSLLDKAYTIFNYNNKGV